MSERFCEKLALVVKVLALSRSELASALGVDKSVVGRWLTGAATPSPHNFSALTRLVSERKPGFTGLDWEADLAGLAESLDVDSGLVGVRRAPRLNDGLPLKYLDDIQVMTARRGSAYEGFYRSTRPYASRPGRFLHDYCLVRRSANGLLSLIMASGGVMVEGWVLLLGDQIFIVASETTSGALVFAILQGVNTIEAEVLDGLTLSPVLDAGRTPTATAIVLHKIAPLSDDPAADEARLKALDSCRQEPEIPESLKRHLVRDLGPEQLARGGDWVLRAPLARSLSRGFLTG